MTARLGSRYPSVGNCWIQSENHSDPCDTNPQNFDCCPCHYTQLYMHTYSFMSTADEQQRHTHHSYAARMHCIPGEWALAAVSSLTRHYLQGVHLEGRFTCDWNSLQQQKFHSISVSLFAWHKETLTPSGEGRNMGHAFTWSLAGVLIEISNPNLTKLVGVLKQTSVLVSEKRMTHNRCRGQCKHYQTQHTKKIRKYLL